MEDILTEIVGEMHENGESRGCELEKAEEPRANGESRGYGRKKKEEPRANGHTSMYFVKIS